MSLYCRVAPRTSSSPCKFRESFLCRRSLIKSLALGPSSPAAMTAAMDRSATERSTNNKGARWYFMFMDSLWLCVRKDKALICQWRIYSTETAVNGPKTKSVDEKKKKNKIIFDWDKQVLLFSSGRETTMTEAMHNANTPNSSPLSYRLNGIKVCYLLYIYN